MKDKGWHIPTWHNKPRPLNGWKGGCMIRMKLSDIGDEYNQALKDGSIAKTMKALFKLDKHHLFTPFKMGYYCARLTVVKNKLTRR